MIDAVGAAERGGARRSVSRAQYDRGFAGLSTALALAALFGRLAALAEGSASSARLRSRY